MTQQPNDEQEGKIYKVLHYQVQIYHSEKNNYEVQSQANPYH